MMGEFFHHCSKVDNSFDLVGFLGSFLKYCASNEHIRLKIGP